MWAVWSGEARIWQNPQTPTSTSRKSQATSEMQNWGWGGGVLSLTVSFTTTTTSVGPRHCEEHLQRGEKSCSTFTALPSVQGTSPAHGCTNTSQEPKQTNKQTKTPSSLYFFFSLQGPQRLSMFWTISVQQKTLQASSCCQLS